MNSSIIDQHCKIIQERNGISIEELKPLLDDIVQELNKLKTDANNKVIFNNSLQEILNVSDNLDINHESFFIFRDTLVTLLNKWDNLSEQETKLCQKITVLFYSIMNGVNETNVTKCKALFCNKTFIDPVKSYVDAVTKNIKHSEFNTHLSNLNYIVLGLNGLQMKQKELQDDPALLTLLDSLVNLICSHCYIDTFKQLEFESSPLGIKQSFLLLTCPYYIINYDGKRVHDISEVISNFLLPSYCLDILQRFTPIISTWTDEFIQCMSNFISMLQYIVFGDSRKLYGHIHLRLIDYIYIILIEFTLEKIEKEAHLSNLILYTIVYLYSLTFDPSLLTCIKLQQKFIQILLKLVEVNNHRIQVNAYRIIATIMSEDDVKRLENPGKITHVFIHYIELFIDNVYRRTVLENTLLGLKSRLLLSFYECSVPLRISRQHF
ncbi:unnamed protein product [Didymodactylos carnosus]|uniref:Uncharacterized protein n=1 Tax=Didymodactylos carnosus TaxID=1234261 RepID=A0A815EKI5_9BILA|nr:unnamed protein product [Didymodactylos carnosus]CAF1312712.1 unnamed protein product [Didymodactylos carnosus]CAF4090871.1 unnamed protein product [Didymodactylos carnosus]CAF4151653.1 unnamed protein product [Didymodactylos carnosus]